MQFKYIFFLINVTNLLIEIEAAINLQNDFAKLVKFDDTFIKITSFKFYKKSRNVAALNVTYNLLKDVTTDEDMKVKISALEFKGNEYKKTVIDFTVGICTLYRANKFDALSLIKDSNLSGCPFPKGSYYINDIAPTTDLLPPFFPEGKWLLDLAFINHGKVITQVQWMLTVLRKINK